MGERAFARIIADLRRSGSVTVGANNYPYLFDDGNAGGTFAAHSHAPAQHEAQAGDPDFGSTREIVFALPADADGNGVPDTDAAGNLVWGAAESSYVLVTRATGVNALERRTNAAQPEAVATYVERVAFDTNATDITIPLDAVRVRIYFRLQEPNGFLYRNFVETVVKLRNG